MARTGRLAARGRFGRGIHRAAVQLGLQVLSIAGLAERAHSRAARALQLWPDFADTAILYGTILYMVREDQEAEKVLTKAHQLRPADPAVNQLLAELHAHAAGGR